MARYRVQIIANNQVALVNLYMPGIKEQSWFLSPKQAREIADAFQQAADYIEQEKSPTWEIDE